MRCVCDDVSQLDGVAASRYARDHLAKTSVDHETWTVSYVCDETGLRWICDYPHPEAHGNGPARLRRITP